MPITVEQETYYKSCVHELNRAIFFGNCPNYVDMMDAEIKRLDAADNDFKQIKKGELDDFSKVKPFGEKKGSPNEEKEVKDRTGVTKREKNKDA